MKTALQYRLFKLPVFWLALLIPAIIAALLVYFVLSDYHNVLDNMTYAAAVVAGLLITVLLATPCIGLVILNHRNVQMNDQLQLQRKQTDFANHYLHVEHFTSHMGTELLKRLGISPRVLHCLFYPGSRQGDFAVNQKLLNFIHSQMLEVVQAAQVVSKLSSSRDDDELVVCQNRLEFAINNSVALMYFLAEKLQGQKPQCSDFHFLKDAMADYYDLLIGVTHFDGMANNNYDLEAYHHLFGMPDNKAWFSRNDHFLRRSREDNLNDNPLNNAFEQI